METPMEFRPLDECRAALAIVTIQNSFIGDEERRCKVTFISPHASCVSVFRGDTLEFTYEINVRRHPRLDYPVMVIESQTPSGPRTVETIENGIHIENVHEAQLKQHFFLTWRRMCEDH